MMRSLYYRSKNASKFSAPLVPQQELDLPGILFHDLRSSLTSLFAIIHMQDSGCHESTDYPVKAKLAVFINKIGNFSSMLEESLQMVCALDEDNRLELHLVDLRFHVVEPVISVFISDVKTKRISMQTRLGPVTGFLSNYRINKTILQMIFHNLLSDAVNNCEFSGINDIDIKPDSPFFLLKIANTGRPITEELYTKLFLKPLPPKDRKETNPDGMGLGLHLAKQIIQTHGRDIWHEPDTGRTAFILAIPKEISDTHFTTHTKDTLFS